MQVSSVRIRNYRSLEDVTLDRIRHLNVIIGRNNAGKSSIGNALQLLWAAMQGNAQGWPQYLTRAERSRSLALDINGHPSADERRKILSACQARGLDPARQESLLSGPLLREVSFSFATEPDAQMLHLRRVSLRTEDDRWSAVAQLVGDARAGNPEFDLADDTSLQSGPLTPEKIWGSRTRIRLSPALLNEFANNPGWPMLATATALLLVDYLHDSFFFSAFRHSQQRMPATENAILSQDGANLAQVIHTVQSNDRAVFNRIESFVTGAIPDIGLLQTPLIQNHTEVAFRSPSVLTPLYDMGGGVEQLLMVATVLNTSRDSGALVLEEPESHLHPGAQRFLLEQLISTQRQVFVATHSPVFLGLSAGRVFSVVLADGLTRVHSTGSTDDFADILDELGVRNSDVLLADGVAFVEGPGDRDVIEILGRRLGMSSREQNVNLLTLGGTHAFRRSAAAAADLLRGLSARSPVPHLIVIDRDERDERAVERLKATVGDNLYVLDRHEIENYFLQPGTLRRALATKCRDNEAVLARLEAIDDEQLGRIVEAAAGDLRHLVILKRVRAALGGVEGGVLAAALLDALAAEKPDDLVRAVTEVVKRHLADVSNDEKIADSVRNAQEGVDAVWSDPAIRLQLAPGADIVAAVFRSVGAEYRRPSDTRLLAESIDPKDVAPEIRSLLKRIANLPESADSTARGGRE